MPQFVMTIKVKPDPAKVPPIFSALDATLKRRIRRWLSRFALDVERVLKDKLNGQNAGFAPNNPIWSMIKGAGKGPMFNTGTALASKTERVIHRGVGRSYGSVEVGFSNSEIPTGFDGGGSQSASVIASRLNRGRTWTPTKKQRQAFWMQLPKDIREQVQGRTEARRDQWRIPRRPFMTQVQNDKVLRAKFNRLMRTATQEAIRDIEDRLEKTPGSSG